MKKTISLGSIIAQVFLILWLLLCLFPLYWLFCFSLKDTQEIFSGNLIGLPTQWLFTNYANAWHSANISLFLLNSVIDTVATLLITSLLGFMCAYGLLRMR